ncbi:site-specific recombinase XerD [Anaerolinea thermolimosa]|uniref:tyrosine-type recombinase/integrase n=1 Tax=Anaerolinea thermolimosa TaxID=229919 RepID=UPI000786606D|nr:tyrosine-type recombinase/integrase [Anaerolinea thermolimosa]GAP07133.1 site-specific recombinase XerD [Anaerolinea thermolimosa]
MSGFVLTHLTSFLQDRKIKGRSLKTISLYQSELRLFQNWLGEREVNATTLREYFLELGTHRNRGGVHCSYRVIKSFLNWLVEEEILVKNPIDKVKIPSSKLAPLPEYTQEEVKKLLKVANLRDTAIIKCLIDTGCRANELLSLQIKDIHFTSGQVLIRHGKGDKPRIVWLGKEARKSLQEYLSTREVTPESPLFINQRGEKLAFFGLREIIKRLCKRAGVTHRGLHSFRRYFALTLYRRGIDILSISRLLGHTSIEVTKRYLNINNEDLQRVMESASPADFLFQDTQKCT